MSNRDPQTPQGRALRAKLSAARWARVVEQAEARAAVFDAVMEHQQSAGQSLRASVAHVAPGLPWPTFVRWTRRHRGGDGESWERLLDQRTPPHANIDEPVRRAACTLRRADPGINTDGARAHLIGEFGAAGAVSDTWLRRVWKAAGLKHVRPTHRGGSRRRAAPGAKEEVEHLTGGAGLAMLAAAEAELGCMQALAESALAAGLAHSEAQVLGDEVVDDAVGRDEKGKFTPEYNARRRGSTPPGQADARWNSDADKAASRPLATLQTLQRPAEVLAARMLAMGVSPMVLNSRGFDGLVSPTGAWLGALGSVAYMPTSLDKTLAELGLLDVHDAMWLSHAQRWHEISKLWSGPETSWLRTAVYIDGTADPYWTHAFAKSGKVSRVGRVMPCLSRIAINSGAGVPLLIETHVGAMSLKKRLLPMLAKLDAAIGPAARVGRLTVVDSEMGTAAALWAMHDQAQAIFITVIKGRVLAGATIHSQGPWQGYRERDELCEVDFTIRGKDVPPEGLRFRGVQMRRDDSRHPHTTVFATNAHEDDLPTAEVANHYLARWPLQEQLFRNARKGGALKWSHGYSGGEVQHVALVDKLSKAERSVELAQQRLDRSMATREGLAKGLARVPRETRTPALALADKQVRETRKQLAGRRQALERLQTMPEQIYARDTGRDGIMTCLKMTVIALTEFVLKEYFGGLGMEWRTFIDQLVPMPVTVRSSARRLAFQIHPNARNPKLMAEVATAVAEINRRGLHRGQQLLTFEILPAAGGGP